MRTRQGDSIGRWEGRTLAVETIGTQNIGTAAAATMGFVVFSMFNIAVGLSARSETGTVFTTDTVSDQRQLKLY